MQSIAKTNVSGSTGERLHTHESKPEVKSRESGIELLKLLSIFLIVISHVAQSLGGRPVELPELADQLIPLAYASENIQHTILSFFRHFGELGNNIFLISSFWFLCESKGFKLKKVLTLLLDVWLISMLFLTVYIAVGENITFSMILSCVFPNIFGNNWFATCYILLYLIHPYLNMVTERISQKTHLCTCITSLILYCGIAFLDTDRLFYSQVIQAVVLYFLVSYIKHYLPNRSSYIKTNVLLLLCGLLGIIGMLLVTNFLGLRATAFSEEVLRWCVGNNPFIILTAVGLFNLFRQLRFANRGINYLASLSLVVYVVHENILFRSFTRIRIWVALLERFGQDTIVLQTLVYAIALFAAAYVVSILYQSTLHKAVAWLANHVERWTVKLFDSLTEKIMKLR